MRKTKSETALEEHGGRCEMCNRSDGGVQQAVPVFLGGGLGQGTMWKCARCIQAQKDGKDVVFE